MPAAVTTPAGSGAGQVAADHRADRQRDQEPHQHQRGHQLRAGVDGGAGEDRDVDERRDQRRADEEADQHRAPGGGTAQRAGRDQRRGRTGAGAARRRPSRARRRGGTRGPGRRRPAPSGRRWRTPGSRRPARARAAARRARRPRAAVRIQSRMSNSGRLAVQQRTTSSTSGGDRGHAERGQPAAVAGDRDEQLAPGQVAHQLAGLDEHEHAGDERDQRPGARPSQSNAGVSRLAALAPRPPCDRPSDGSRRRARGRRPG